ncbi:unnamed protein product, partial [Amoebophrya sp. A25]|eukprot:GSA25T00007381001.1
MPSTEGENDPEAALERARGRARRRLGQERMGDAPTVQDGSAYKLISDFEQLEEHFEGLEVHDSEFIKKLMSDKKMSFWKKAQVLRMGGRFNVMYADYEKRAEIRELAKKERKAFLAAARQEELHATARGVRAAA